MLLFDGLQDSLFSRSIERGSFVPLKMQQMKMNCSDEDEDDDGRAVGPSISAAVGPPVRAAVGPRASAAVGPPVSAKASAPGESTRLVKEGSTLTKQVTQNSTPYTVIASRLRHFWPCPTHTGND